jgi:hypothetical protein
MMNGKPRWRKISRLCLVVLLASTLSFGMIAGYYPYSDSIPVEVKEPIEFLSYPTVFSLFPGETIEFNVTIQNLASVNYSVALDFILNNTAYQTEYVTFSDRTYTITPGEQNLVAWLKVATEAPAVNLLLAVSVVRLSEESPTPEVSPSPSLEPSPSLSNSTLELTPMCKLLGSGARWAAGNGTSALVINWLDTYETHHLTDGADWGPWPEEETMERFAQSILQALEQNGLNVETVGDIPDDLSVYDLVVVHSYWAVEPKHNGQLRDYVSNGGSVVILSGVPCMLNVYCKDWWPGGSTLPDWIGGGYYVNAGGDVTVAVDKPFGTSFQVGDSILHTNSYSCAGVNSPTNNGQIIAQWDTGYQSLIFDDGEQGIPAEYEYSLAFAFTNEFGQGRVYYQAVI